MALNDTTPEHIKEIVLRFLEGSASEEDVTILFHWLKEDEKNREYFDEVNTTFHTSVTLNRFTQQKTDDAWMALSSRIDSEKGKLRTLRPLRISFNKSAFRIAASICLIAVTWYIFVKLLSKTDHQRPTLVKNSIGNNTRILLPDSSVVLLNTNSTLEYPSEFGIASREVVLKGEAFFDVKKGSKPFIVKTENIQIQVKGTRFNVQAYKNDQAVKTTLEEGKVELQVSGDERVYTLKPGDQAILNTDVNKVTLKKVDPSNFTAWKEEKLIFDNTPLKDIISKLENRFHVTISLDSAIARRERLTMTIERESLDEILDLIVLSSDLRVKKENDKIILFE
ncbi:MAG: FecR domain-containing protein [Chryseolinea sp.]